MRSPGQMLQESGGIEGLLQEAAKGMYRRSEQWGLSQAFRNAVHGLQSGSNTPRRSSSARHPFDEDRPASDLGELSGKLQALEDRNKILAKMLQESIEDISMQAKEFEKEKQEAGANRLTLSIAKLQFLQIHLENSAMPLITHSTGQEGRRVSHNDRLLKHRATRSSSNDQTAPVASQRPVLSRPVTTKRQDGQDSEAHSPTRAPIRRPAHISAVPRITRTESPQQQSPFQSSRPSLAQSSFSWMLGTEDNKTNFVSAAPFSPERDRKNAARGKAGFLFGDDKDQSSQARTSKEKAAVTTEDSDGFTLGTLKGTDKR